MKYLIVNADDFGASRGINRAVVELHACGILTSASLMIDMPAATDAVERAHNTALGVGLHVTLTSEDASPLLDFDDSERCRSEMRAQLERFRSALGRLPTHLDSHQNVHRDSRLGPLFLEMAREHDIPLREHSPARYFSSFYGQWDGETHPEHISVENLIAMLEREAGEGVTELSCHPGYVGPDFDSPYNREREMELHTLRDPRVLRFIRERRITLISFRELPAAVHV